MHEWNTGGKPTRKQCNQLFNAVVTILKYKKRTVDHDIYIKVFSDGTVSYLTVSTDDVLKNSNNKTAFPELRKCCCCCLPGHWSVRYVQIMMLQPWTGKPTDQFLVAYCSVDILLTPAPLFSARHPMSVRGAYLLIPHPSLCCRPSCLHTRSFTHPGVTCLRPSIPRPVALCIRLCYLPASLTLAMPTIFPTMLPCRRRNFF